jgi:hypothetical protein
MVSAHLVPLHLCHGEAGHYVRKLVVEQSSLLRDRQEAKRRQERTREKIPFKVTYLVTYFLRTDPLPIKVMTPSMT